MKRRSTCINQAKQRHAPGGASAGSAATSAFLGQRAHSTESCVSEAHLRSSNSLRSSSRGSIAVSSLPCAASQRRTTRWRSITTRTFASTRFCSPSLESCR